jgi:Cu(I)/Ag(I) efflux system membrane fusion protein
MSSNGPSAVVEPTASGHDAAAGAALSRWQKVRLVVKVVELRLRFIALMAATALVFAYWDELANRYDKWMRPASRSSSSSIGVAAGLEFYCPMHPQVVQEAPGSCPICGMPLARRKKGEKAPLPPGVTARVELAPGRVAQAGIRTEPVAYAPLVRTVTAVGLVAFDERRLANIVAKVPGKTRVEKLHVNYTGQDVAVGQTLAELYSPELAQAVQELLSASRRAEPAPSPASRPQSAVARALEADRHALVVASVEKLRRWGITQAQVDEILRSGKTDVTIPIFSPIRGHVFKKNVVEGQEVGEGFAMFEVADLDTVWVQAQVYEHELGLVEPGQPAEAHVEAFPGRTFPGRVEFIQPHLDPATRTVEVRFALENADHRLRPGMFATVVLKTPVARLPEFQARAAAGSGSGSGSGRAHQTAHEQEKCPVTTLKLGSMGAPVPVEVEGRKVWTCCPACTPKLKAKPAVYLARLEQAPPPSNEVLSVPESAVIDTGRKTVVYVESEPGVFEGRAVVLGPRTGDRFPVLEGLAPGERVAAAGAFLIDAESRINPGTSAAAEPAPAKEPKAATHSHRH